MTPKKIFLIFLILPILIYGKNYQWNKQFPRNHAIKYEIIYKSFQFIDSANASPSKYVIRVELTKSQRQFIKSLKKDDWISLFSNNETDWAANLILYDIYQKDAILYNSVILSKGDWVTVIKEKDILYWKEFLK